MTQDKDLPPAEVPKRNLLGQFTHGNPHTLVYQEPKFKTAEEFANKVHEYFCEGVSHKMVVTGRADNKKTEYIPVPTITEMALFMGYAGRSGLYDAEKLPHLAYVLKRARSFIEVHYEQMLQVGNTIGAIFALKNMGWSDKTEITGSIGVKHSFDPEAMLAVLESERHKAEDLAQVEGKVIENEAE